MPTLVGLKGQVVIEKEIRDKLGIGPGAIAIQTLVGDRVEIQFIPPMHTESLFGVLAPHVRREASTQSWAEVKRRAWQAAANRKEAGAGGRKAAAARENRARKRTRRKS